MFFIILAFSLSSIGDKQTAIGQFLSNKHMVWLGEISFCFYLIHLLVIKIIEHFVIKFSLNIDSLLLLIIILGITIIASAISYKHIEKPLNRKVKEYLL
ncbi:Acyltransferase family protein [compost metagenome]